MIQPNCNLASPPAQSGEDAHMLWGLAKVYPRASDINSEYAGCQLLWTNDGESLESWSLSLKLFYSGGELVRSQTFQGSSVQPIECNYKKKKLVAGEKESCYPASEVPLISMRPGCLKELLDASHDRAKELPKDCMKYE